MGGASVDYRMRNKVKAAASSPRKLIAPAPSTKLRRGFAVMPLKQRSAIAALGGKSHSREHLARIGALGGAAKGLSAAAKRPKCAIEKRPSYTASKRKDSSQ